MRQRGISLIELIMFIVIVSAALAGILMVMNVTSKGSVDPLIHKQALAIAESLLEEIELQDFVAASGVAHVPVTTGNRANAYHIVSDYAGYPNTPGASGIYALDGTPLPGLSAYNASVAIGSAALGDITAPSGNAVLITVTVTVPRGDNIEVSGYRTAHP